jgi:hypothetical protein
MEAFTVRRVKYSQDLLHKGDYFFVAKRHPNITVERVPVMQPQGILERIWWNWFGKKEELKQIVEIVWPEHDAIIVNCPQCNQPSASTKNSPSPIFRHWRTNAGATLNRRQVGEI